MERHVLAYKAKKTEPDAFRSLGVAVVGHEKNEMPLCLLAKLKCLRSILFRLLILFWHVVSCVPCSQRWSCTWKVLTPQGEQ